MSMSTKPVAKRTRSQRLLYYQECVKNASKAHGSGSATTTHIDLVTSSDDSQNSIISSKDSDDTYDMSSSDDLDEDAVDILDHDTTSNQFPRSVGKEKVCPGSVKTKGGSRCENIASQSEAGTSQRQAGVGVSVTQTNGHEEYANKAQGSGMGKHTYYISSSDDSDEGDDSSYMRFLRDAVFKSGSQCEGGKQSQSTASQSQAGAGQGQAGVKPSSSTRWTKLRIAHARGIATDCDLSQKVYQRVCTSSSTSNTIGSNTNNRFNGLVYHRRGKEGV